MEPISESQHAVVEQYLSGKISKKQAAEAAGIDDGGLNDFVRQLHPFWLAGDPFTDAADWKARVTAQWRLFLEKWPIERLKSMTVEEYAVGNQRCSFCYWLEHGAKAFAQISGRCGVRMFECFFKDGVEEHAHKEVSFEALRALVVAVAQAAAQKNMLRLTELFQKRNRCGLWSQVFWKIALLYQPIAEPFLRPFLSKRDDAEEDDYPKRQAQFLKDWQASG